MKKIFLSLGALVAAMILTVAGDEASANLIVGPTSAYYTGTVGGNASTPPSQPSTWGIQFTANKNSHLISFDFNQNGSIYGNLNAGTIALKDVTTSTTVDTWGVPVVPSYGAVANTVSFSGFDDILHSGTSINSFTHRPLEVTATKSSHIFILPAITRLTQTPTLR